GKGIEDPGIRRADRDARPAEALARRQPSGQLGPGLPAVFRTIDSAPAPALGEGRIKGSLRGVEQDGMAPVVVRREEGFTTPGQTAVARGEEAAEVVGPPRLAQSHAADPDVLAVERIDRDTTDPLGHRRAGRAGEEVPGLPPVCRSIDADAGV